MKINELTNLWVGFNQIENFRILICALDLIEAQEIANDYCIESHMNGGFEIEQFNNMSIHFDCDYVLTNGQ